MKSKAFLPLMEQILMIAVFALAAALCLQGFATADSISRNRQNKDYAVIAAQNAAERVKLLRGDMQAAAEPLSGVLDGNTVTVIYSENGTPAKFGEEEAFRIVIEKKESSTPLLEYAEIRAISGGEVIFELTVGWQKGAGNEN